MPNVVALCVGFSGVVLFTYLLRAGSLGGNAYAALLTVLAVLCVAIAKIDLVEILDLKNMRLEVQKAREDVYAKVEELQKTAAGVASFTAASIITENRFVGLDAEERMLRRRDELERFLRDAGVPEERRAELIRPITVMVDWDLRRAIVIDAVSAWLPPPGAAPTDATKRDVMQRGLETILQKTDRPAALTEATTYLNALGVASEGLTQSIDHYNQFLSTGRLPRFGSTADIRTPPLP